MRALPDLTPAQRGHLSARQVSDYESRQHAQRDAREAFLLAMSMPEDCDEVDPMAW